MPRRPRSNSSSSDSGSDSSDSIDNKVTSLVEKKYRRKNSFYSVNANPKVMSKSSSDLSRSFVESAKSRHRRLNRTWKVWERFWSRIWLSSRWEFRRYFSRLKIFQAVHYWNFDMCRLSNARENDHLFHFGWVAQLTRRQIWRRFPTPCLQGAGGNAHLWALGGRAVHYSLHFRHGVISAFFDSFLSTILLYHFRLYFRHFYSHNLIGVHNVGFLLLLVLHGQV